MLQVPDSLKEELLGILQEVGGVTELSGRQLKFSSLAFQRSSPHQTTLLWNMLRLARGGMKYKYKALVKLGEQGDSRAVNLIHSVLDSEKTTHDDRLVRECITCLGRIGDPRSMSYPSGSHVLTTGGMRISLVVQELEKQGLNYWKWHTVNPEWIKRLGSTRLRHWLLLYKEVREDRRLRRTKKVLENLAWAERNVHPPYDEL